MEEFVCACIMIIISSVVVIIIRSRLTDCNDRVGKRAMILAALQRRSKGSRLRATLGEKKTMDQSPVVRSSSLLRSDPAKLS
jgi:hypothetical protein